MPKTTTRPMVSFHNTDTNEIINREMNEDEYAQYLKDVEDDKALKAEVKAKETARAAILDRLGLTADEAAMLLG
jgi:hypothetical protein